MTLDSTISRLIDWTIGNHEKVTGVAPTKQQVLEKITGLTNDTLENSYRFIKEQTAEVEVDSLLLCQAIVDSNATLEHKYKHIDRLLDYYRTGIKRKHLLELRKKLKGL